jgi:hypothetical protein
MNAIASPELLTVAELMVQALLPDKHEQDLLRQLRQEHNHQRLKSIRREIRICIIDSYQNLQPGVEDVVVIRLLHEPWCPLLWESGRCLCEPKLLSPLILKAEFTGERANYCHGMKVLLRHMYSSCQPVIGSDNEDGVSLLDDNLDCVIYDRLGIHRSDAGVRVHRVLGLKSPPDE